LCGGRGRERLIVEENKRGWRKGGKESERKRTERERMCARGQ
jgi:hypothetical protein